MRTRLYVMSGLACDERLFAKQRGLPLDVRFLPWITPRGDEPVGEYAERMGEGIDTSEPFLLGGVSFGGMMAMQMVKYVKPRAVILISSCRRPRELPGWYTPPAGWATGLVAPSVLKKVLCDPRVMTFPFGPMDPETRKLLIEMAGACCPKLFAWSIRTVTRLPEPACDVPVHAIHGRLDRIIPVRRGDPEVIVENAGHMINLTHAEAVNRFIIERAKRYE